MKNSVEISEDIIRVDISLLERCKALEAAHFNISGIKVGALFWNFLHICFS